MIGALLVALLSRLITIGLLAAYRDRVCRNSLSVAS
jgi:hypothetical protein